MHTTKQQLCALHEPEASSDRYLRPKAVQFMHQLFWIKVCSDLLGAVIDRDQRLRPVRHATDISINQTECERDLPVAMDLYHVNISVSAQNVFSG